MKPLLDCVRLYMVAASAAVVTAREPVQKKLPVAHQPINFELLVQSLRSANRKPRIKAGDATFDDNYDFSEQRRIHKAIRTLQLYADEAWPNLVAQLDNEEYSITLGYGAGAVNYSVAQVCEQIIRNSLASAYLGFDVFLEGTSNRGADLENPAILETEQLKQWLVARRSKSLIELQLETLDVLSKRIEQFDLSRDKKKMFAEGLVERKAHLARWRVPELSFKFIPGRKIWWFPTPDRADE